jgi:hypothetical protein
MGCEGCLPKKKAERTEVKSFDSSAIFTLRRSETFRPCLAAGSALSMDFSWRQETNEG